MCGLFAYKHPHATAPETIDGDAVLSALVRRGPDGNGVLKLRGCDLFHTRLAILDRDHGQQPMMHRQSGVAIAYNGEVYNAPQLREDLSRRGHKFRTATDTEVVLTAFVEYGAGCAAFFEGMFAYAIWDPCEQTLHVARDRLGEKPLYFTRRPDGTVMVSSEIKALRAAGVESTIDLGVLDHYLQWKYAPPDRTIYSDIEVVPAAHTIAFGQGVVTRHRYWELPPTGTRDVSYATALDELHELLSSSVCKRLQSDRQISIFLSGGIDSAIIAALAARQAGERLTSIAAAYSAGLDESGRAAAVAARLGTRHVTVPVPSFMPDVLEAVCAYLDQPHADTANLAHALLSRRAADYGPVVLAGDGADELFGGYGWYGDRDIVRARRDRMTIFSNQVRRRLLPRLSSDDWEGRTGDEGFERANSLDLTHYLGGQLLPKADMLGMMHGVELRSPMLDFALVEFARSLPTEYKTGRHGKPLLRDLHRRLLPDVPSVERKQGFGAPLLEYLNEPSFNAYARKILGPDAMIRNMLASDELDRQIASNFDAADHRSAYRIWTLLCLELWARRTRPVKPSITHISGSSDFGADLNVSEP